VSGPKKPKLPQRVAKFEPTSVPSSSAANAAAGLERQRGWTNAASPMKVRGSGTPRNVPNATRMISSAAGRSLSARGRTETSGLAGRSVILRSGSCYRSRSSSLGATASAISAIDSAYGRRGSISLAMTCPVLAQVTGLRNAPRHHRRGFLADSRPTRELFTRDYSRKSAGKREAVPKRRARNDASRPR
jgi:hypothetical protein